MRFAKAARATLRSTALHKRHREPTGAASRAKQAAPSRQRAGFKYCHHAGGAVRRQPRGRTLAILDLEEAAESVLVVRPYFVRSFVRRKRTQCGCAPPAPARMPEVPCESDEQQRQVTADVQGTAASFADLLLPVRGTASCFVAGALTMPAARARAQPAQGWLFAAVAGAAMCCAAGSLRRRPDSTGVSHGLAPCAAHSLRVPRAAGQVWHRQNRDVRHHHT